jgi:glycerol-3-phosphate cytidylyltransferase-like family protein
MNHVERCEAVRHCRWVDEVIPDAPWVLDTSFLEKYKIDYVAHDDEPYLSAGHDDVYAFVKSLGLSRSPQVCKSLSGHSHVTRQIHPDASHAGYLN